MKRSAKRRPEIAIIGYGRFGKLAAHYLKNHFSVFVHDKRSVKTETGIKRVSLRDAALKRNILLAVPINALPSVLKTLAPNLAPGTLVVDVCSVKEQPVAWMKHILPQHVSILGTHPLFGPDSASDRLNGRPIAICPVRISKKKLKNIKTTLSRLGLVVRQTSPTKHDKLMASTLFLTQFIGHTVSRIHLPDTDITTQNFQSLKHIAATSSNDSKELFRDMYQYNRHAKRIPGKLLTEFLQLNRFLSKKNRD